MAKLLVKYGKNKKNKPFHPRLLIRDTGYSRGHWQEQHFREGCFVGAGTIFHKSVEQAISDYFAELSRMGYEVIQE